MAALLLLPIANGAVRRALLEANGFAPGNWRSALRQAFAYSGRLRVFDQQFSGIALDAGCLLAMLIFSRENTQHAGKREPAFRLAEFPVAASAEIARLPALTPGCLRPDKYGGYLIYRFNCQRKVFFRWPQRFLW